MIVQGIRAGGARSGVAMLYAVFAAFAAATMVSMMMTLSLSTNRTAAIKRQGVRARFMAEGAVEVAKRDISEAVANWKAVPPTGQVTIDGTTVTYGIQPTGLSAIQTEPTGIQKMVDGFQIEATATVAGHSRTAHRLVEAQATPVFQFAVFYDRDLEINPGPSMTLGGRVHSNSDMFLNCGGTLTLDTNYVRAAGDIYRHRKDNPGKSKGTVDVRNWVQNPYDPSEPTSYFTMNSESQMSALGVPSTSGYDSNFVDGWDANLDGDFDDPDDWYPWTQGALTYWGAPSGYGTPGYTVQNSVHGIAPASVPQIASVQMFEPTANGTHYFDPASGEYKPAAAGMGTHSKGFYHAKADLSIITYADDTFKAFDAAGNDITLTLNGAIGVTTMYDARQAGGAGGDVTVTMVDMEALGNSVAWPDNGLIYAAQYGAGTGTDASGLRLNNGDYLATPLTVVSENSIYINGDYNTSLKKGAAVIGDAINLLSKAWDDTKSSSSSLPVAGDTTFNVAIMTGNNDTVAGGYNGGLENLPRFHESWSGVSCQINGSFVNLWNSQYANAPWKYGGNVYKAPARNWAYDTMFNNVANLPPFTPMAVDTVDVAVW